MSNDLEEIKSLVFIHFGALGFCNPSMNNEIIRDRDKVLKYLDSLETIDNSNPSEALECLGRIRDFLLHKTKEISFQDLRDIEQTLLKSQSQEDKTRAFDLINEKDIDIKLLKWAYPSVEAYNVKVRERKDYWWRKELTPEEFEFIGKVAGAK